MYGGEEQSIRAGERKYGAWGEEQPVHGEEQSIPMGEEQSIQMGMNRSIPVRGWVGGWAVYSGGGRAAYTNWGPGKEQSVRGGAIALRDKSR